MSPNQFYMFKQIIALPCHVYFIIPLETSLLIYDIIAGHHLIEIYQTLV